MNNVDQVRWRVLRTRLESVLRRAEQAPDGEELALGTAEVVVSRVGQLMP